MKEIAVLGSTGSVGSQAADVVASHPDLLRACVLGARQNAHKLGRQANRLRPDIVALSDASREEELRSVLEYKPAIVTGPDALSSVLGAVTPDKVLLSVSGMTALPLFAQCLERGLAVALASKEAVVAGGSVVRRLWDASGASVYPVDTEHGAIFQCLGDSYDTTGVRRLWITASGGPFRGWSPSQLEKVQPDQALRHPNWNMGPKITIDSATLANKGLEVIEAHFLYRMPPDRISVVVQPTSVVHSMVEFDDTSVLAQLASPDVRLPIQRALLGSDALSLHDSRPLDFLTLGSITFEAPDTETFPCLSLAYESIRRGLTAVYNAADEEAVELFLAGRIRFCDIPRLIRESLQVFDEARPGSISEILRLDRKVRTWVRAAL